MIKFKYNFGQTITLLYLIMILTGCLTTNESDEKSYIVVFAYMIIMLFYIAYKKCVLIIRYPFVITLLIIAVWAYGFILGIINDNNMSHIIRNFVGMTVYLLLIPLLNCGFSNKQFMNIIIFFSYYALLVTFFTGLLGFIYNVEFLSEIPFLNAFVGGGGTGGFIQYFCRELIHVCFAYNFYLMLYRSGRRFIPFMIVMLALFEFVCLNDSGGDLLAIATLVISIVVVNSLEMKMNLSVLATILFIIFGTLLFNVYMGQGFLSILFSDQDGGNIRRLVELNYFLNNMTIEGWGLGKELGVAGAGEYNYGTELIYLNLFHKFGVFALVIIGCYVSTLVKAFYYMKKNRTAESTVPLALMAYLLPSLANPMLFSTLSVTSHLLSMIIFSRENETSYN